MGVLGAENRLPANGDERHVARGGWCTFEAVRWQEVCRVTKAGASR